MNRKLPVIAIFDIGKTNKKLLLFDEQYILVKEVSVQLEEIKDDEGFPCEDIDLLTSWIMNQVQQLKSQPEYLLKAINFTTYGASLVFINNQGRQIGYLYNYLKPYPQQLWDEFLKIGYPDSAELSVETCSPLMGHLNAGMQLFWLKHARPKLYEKVSHVLHFPQYLSYLFTGRKVAELTNLGCHSAMWNFHEDHYHYWLKKEGIAQHLCSVTSAEEVTYVKESDGNTLAIGIGMHDSSAAIVPYLQTFSEPFMVLSTGTWSISLNPFNQSLSNSKELGKGVLNYLTYTGDPMKVSMLFAGNDHDQQVKRISSWFNVPDDFYKSLYYDESIHQKIIEKNKNDEIDYLKNEISKPTDPCVFHLRNLKAYDSAQEAYYQLIEDLIAQQTSSTQLVLASANVQHLFVDGGFSKNEIYMCMLSKAFPKNKVAASSMKEGTALGAALAIHKHWNCKNIPSSLINLLLY